MSIAPLIALSLLARLAGDYLRPVNDLRQAAIGVMHAVGGPVS